MVGRISGGKCSDMRGWICSLCVCDANECRAVPFSFIFYFIFWVMAPPPVPPTLYSDCLQARRHFPVKVSLMNSNDPSEWLRQVIHNHSSFTFSSSPVTSLLFLPSFPLFLQLNQTPVPIKGHNSLSLSCFNCGCWVEPLNRLLIRMDAARVIFMMSDQGRCFWEWATKHWARGHGSAQSESWFSHHSTQSYHHLPPQTHLSFIDLTQKAFQWKMFWMEQYVSSIRK